MPLALRFTSLFPNTLLTHQPVLSVDVFLVPMDTLHILLPILRVLICPPNGPYDQQVPIVLATVTVGLLIFTFIVF